MSKAFCYHVLEHVYDTSKTFAEVSRCLKDDGIWVIETPNSIFVKGYSFPITETLRKIFPTRLFILPRWLIGNYILMGHNKTETKIGHIHPGFSINQLKNLGLIYGLQLERGCIVSIGYDFIGNA